MRLTVLAFWTNALNFSVALSASCSATGSSGQFYGAMAKLPSGIFVIGCGPQEGCPLELTRTVRTSEFAIDKYEATVESYDECVKAGACPNMESHDRGIPNGAPASEIALLSARSAAAYCRWRGGRVPADIEWEIAATGGDGRQFSWGNTFSEALLPDYIFRAGLGYYFSPGMVPAGNSPFGVSDMTGTYPEFVVKLTGGMELRGSSSEPLGYPTNPREYRVRHSVQVNGVAVGGVRCVYSP